MGLVAPPRVDAYPFNEDRNWYNADTFLVAYLLWTAPRYSIYLTSLKEATAKLEAVRTSPDKIADHIGAKIKHLMASDFFGCSLVVNFGQIAQLFLNRYRLNDEKLTKAPTKKRVGRPKKNVEYD